MELPEGFFSRVEPVPVSAPRMVVSNDALARELGLSPQALRSKKGVQELSGNSVPKGGVPIAQAYAGHQFGQFTMLGDGRAILLGEQIAPGGERYDVQLKGSGRTPYSRGGDGRASLGPMLREYIISEAMSALGIETTRSLAVVVTGEPVYRQTPEIGAVLTRVASSHLRVGTFEFAAKFGDEDDLRALADYAIERHYPHLEQDEEKYLGLLREVVKRQAALIAKWQMVGFIHGVMNTDNMTISGETIDYGPCAFMDAYSRDTVFSSIDVQGRYAYGNQPTIGGWNLTRFAETLLPILHESAEPAREKAQVEVEKYVAQYRESWMSGMRGKLGLFSEDEGDQALFAGLLALMQEYKADFTNTFAALTTGADEGAGMFDSEKLAQWRKKWKARLGAQQEREREAKQLMQSSNPAIIPRNHRVEEALSAATENGDYGVMERLLEALSKPYVHTGKVSEYAEPPKATGVPYKTYCGT
mgnify:FL=1